MSKLKIGLTGGIGSGKSTIAKCLEALNYPVYYADDRAKFLMDNSSSIKADIIHLLGTDSYSNNGKLNRRYVASQVFNNPSSLNKLNQIVHPAVEEDYLSWHQQQNSSCTFKEAALIFENNSENSFDKIILVKANLNCKINRIKKRDTFRTYDEIKAIINKQLSDEIKMKKAHFIIDNDDDSKVIVQLLNVLDRISG